MHIAQIFSLSVIIGVIGARSFPTSCITCPLYYCLGATLEAVLPLLLIQLSGVPYSLMPISPSINVRQAAPFVGKPVAFRCNAECMGSMV